MLKLGSGDIEFRNFPPNLGKTVLRVTDQVHRVRPLREREGYICRPGNQVPEGFQCYFLIGDGEVERTIPAIPDNLPLVILSPEYAYLSDGDVIRVEPQNGSIRVLYRRSSPNNYFLITERCNSYCLMCSQPPRAVQDDWIIDELLEAIPLVDPDTAEIGFTGGEPFLLGDRFLSVLQLAKSYLPRTAIHVLSNGRLFSEVSLAARYARIAHPDIMVGIPLYSDLSNVHDYVVQADGAYDQTIRGILNLKQHRQRVEIRVVVHQQTFERLPQLAEFIARNLTFVDHVTFMGLEITGFTRANLEKLWIDPFEYQAKLREAVLLLDAHRIHVSVYNHQLCVLDRVLWRFARKSISDWKNEYMPECDGCSVHDQCGGFFSSAKYRHSDHISRIPADI